jgi:peptide/nickel transport system ATP-binding protein
MTLLSVQDLTIGYQTRRGKLLAVSGVSFDLDRGQSLGLVGESGCGKTTIGMALMGLLPSNADIAAGRIRFEDHDLLGMAEQDLRQFRWAQIAMIFQAAMNALNPVQRVEDQIVEAICSHQPDLNRRQARLKVAELFDLVGIPNQRSRDYPHQYSGGMKQRAIIAMALACRPKLIIADEPTTALDVIVQDQILKAIARLQEEFNLSLIFISHDISVVAEVCHRIAVMYAGEIVEYGNRREVFESPAHPYTRALLAAYPTLAGPRQTLKALKGKTPSLVAPPDGCRFADRCEQYAPICDQRAPGWVQINDTHGVRCSCRQPLP